MATTTRNGLNAPYSQWSQGTALTSEDPAALGISADLAVHGVRADWPHYFALVNSIPRHYTIAIRMKPRRWDSLLYDLAEGQSGYFTATQARSAGLHLVRLVQLEHSEDIERVSRGVYRLTRYPVSPLGQYMEAALWPQVRRPGAHGIVSHESALAIYGLSDVSPTKVHITLPTTLRIRRTPPEYLALHYADLEPQDVQQVEGIPVTTAERAIRDVHASHIGPALVGQAIADGRRTGYLTSDQAARLKRELLGRQARSRK